MGRDAEKDALVITDGFSCQNQIGHATDRHGLHLAEVIHLAMHANGEMESYPERSYTEVMRFATDGQAQSNGTTTGWLAVGAAAITALLSR